MISALSSAPRVKLTAWVIKHVATETVKAGTPIASRSLWPGYEGPKGHPSKLNGPSLDDAQRRELDNHLTELLTGCAIPLMRTAEELGPEQLAQRAVDLLCGGVACDNDLVSYHQR